VKRSTRSLAAEQAFKARLVELGATLVEPQWLGGKAPHRVVCAAGHECSPAPGNVAQGHGICLVCAGKDPAAAEQAFKARLEEMGATLVEAEYLGNKRPHRVICEAGHGCSPTPNNVLSGHGICRVCANMDPATAERNFRARLTELGATLVEPEYLGSQRRHRVVCAMGHECSPTPNSLRQGNGVCRVCAERDPAAAEQRFLAKLAELGATAAYAKYLGNKQPHRVVCAAGHECTPTPNSVTSGHGICRVCARMDPATAEAAFRARLSELGATLVEPSYLGSGRPHRVVCAEGHECTPRPGMVQQGVGICRVCAGKDPAAAEQRYLARLAELGATPAYEQWMGADRPHAAVCAAGHDWSTWPGKIRDSRAGCARCAGNRSGFDKSAAGVVYLITHPTLGAHKIGITASGSDRLDKWQRRGWQVYATHHFDIGADAHWVEQSALQWLRTDLGLGPFLRDTDGWSETVDAAAIDLATIWQHVSDDAAAGF
jgi:hypothetical protein